MHGLPPNGYANSLPKFEGFLTPNKNFSNNHTPTGGVPGSSPSPSSPSSGGGSTYAVSQSDEQQARKHLGITGRPYNRRHTRGNHGRGPEIAYEQAEMRVDGQTTNVVVNGSGKVQLDAQGHYQTVDPDTGEVTRSKDTWFNTR